MYPSKMPLPVGDLPGTHKSAPETPALLFQLFLHSSPVRPTHTDTQTCTQTTLHLTSAATGYNYAVHAGNAA